MPVIVVPAPPIALPASASSSDGYLSVIASTTPTGSGVLLRADFSALATWPRKVRFVRSDDDVIVRSGHDVWSPGGVAYAYDFEMPLGVVSSWRAIPIFASAGVFTSGASSTSAAILVADLDEDLDFWLKSTSSPLLSVRTRSQVPDPEYSLAGRDSLTEIPGSSLLSGSWDVPVKQPVAYTFMTRTTIERDALLAVLRAGPLLIQCLRMYGTADGYYLLGSVSENYDVGGFDQRRKIACVFKPIQRPPTEGSPLYVLGRSYQDVDNNYASYSVLDAAVPDYDALLSS